MATTAARLLLGDAPRQPKRRDEIDDLLDQLRRGVEPGGISPPPASPPSFIQRVGGAIGSAASTIGQELLTTGERMHEAETQRLLRETEGAVGAAESAATLATGMVGLGTGATTFMARAFADLGKTKGPDYWKRLYELSKNIAADVTYQPRTEAGQLGGHVLGAVMHPLEEFSRIAADAPLLRMALTDDQRYAVRFAHEMITLAALDPVVRATTSGIRNKMAKFRSEFVKAHDATPSEAPRLITAAEDLVNVVASRPDATEILSAAKQRLSSLRRGEQLELPQPTQGELSLRPGGPPVVPPTPEPTGRGVQLEARFPEEGLLSPSGRVGAEFAQQPAASLLDTLRASISRALDPNISKDVRDQRLGVLKAQLREGHPTNEPIRKTMQDLGFTVDEIAELEGPLKNVRVHKPSPSKARPAQPGEVDVTLREPVVATEVPPQVSKIETPVEAPVVPPEPIVDPAPAISKPKRARTPRKLVKVDEPVVDMVVPPDVPSTPPTPQKTVPPTVPRVNYYPTTIADISRTAHERILATDEPSTPPSGPLSLRYTEGKPDAIMIDPSSFTTVTPLAELRAQVASNRVSPDVAEVLHNKLRQQAEFFGVPTGLAHLYTGETLVKLMTQVAEEFGLELYRAKRTRTGVEYEQIAPEAISAANKLGKASPLAPSKMTPDEASILIEEKTKPVGSPLRDEILQAVDTGDVTILDRVPPDLRDFVDTTIKEARKATDTSEVRRLKDILVDVLDTILPDNPPPGHLNILAQYSLTPERKAAARRLYADLQRVGRSFRDTLRREGVPEPTIALMERYIQEFKDPLPPARVTPADGFRLGEQQAGEPVKHVRTVRRNGVDYDQVPKYGSEIAMMQRPGDLPVKQGLSSLGPEEYAIIPPKASALVPQFGLRAGKVPELKHAYDAAARAGEREFNSAMRDLNALGKVHGIPSREQMGAFGYSHTLQGMEILIENGRDIPSLTRNEQITYNALRDLFDNTWIRVNEVREAAGKEPLPYMADYVPFMRMMSMTDKLGKKVNLFADTPEYIKEQISQYSNLQMPREKLRTGATYTADFDIFHLTQDFLQQALPQIHLAPFLYKLEELAFHALPNPKTGKVDWLLSAQKPRLHAYLRDWHEFLVSGTEPFKSPFWNRTGQFLLKSTSRSMIAYSATTAMVQPTVMINAYHNLGRSALTRGTLDAIAGMPGFFSDPYGTLRNEPGRVQQLYKNSGVLDTRGMQEVFSDVAAAITAVRPRDFMQLMKRGEFGQIMGALDRSIGYKGVQITDHASATITGLGAMRLADRINTNATKRYGEPLLKGQDYWDFVDDLITRTNAGTNPGDVAPIQRTMGGRWLTHMQRFLINDLNFFIEDVLKATSRKDIAQLLDKDPNRYLPAAVKSILAFVTATAIYNFVQEDVLGIRASGGRPLDAARKGIEAGDSVLAIARSVAGEVVQRVPVVGSTKYTSTPLGVVGELGRQTLEAFSERPGAYKFSRPSDTTIETAERIYGSPVAKLLGLRGAANMTRYVRAQDRNAGFWPSITGMTEDTPRQTSSGGRGVGGLRRVR